MTQRCGGGSSSATSRDRLSSFSSGALFHLPQGTPFDIVGPGSHRSTCRRPNADTCLVRGTETPQHHSYTQELWSRATDRLLLLPPASASRPPASANKRLQDTCK
jgi:hypothetical protein